MALKIETLRTFATVAQTGNLADAAARLGRTQSAVSMTLKGLEDHLGQRLFESDRKNRLTPLGQEVYDLARTQIQSFDETTSAIETSSRAPGGLLRIASIPSVAGLVFPSAIAQLTMTAPALKIELRDTDTDKVVDALIRGQADLGVISGNHALNGITQHPYFTDAFGLLCAPTHALARTKGRANIEDVLNSGFVSNNLCSLINPTDLRARLMAARISVPNTLSLLAMVRSGKWVTILPRTVAQIMPDALCFQEIEGLTTHREVSILIRERSTQRPFAETLRDILQAMPPEPAP